MVKIPTQKDTFGAGSECTPLPQKGWGDSSSLTPLTKLPEGNVFDVLGGEGPKDKNLRRGPDGQLLFKEEADKSPDLE